MPIANTSYKIAGWDEKQVHEAEGEPKLARATVRRNYEGDLIGDSVQEYLLQYLPDGTAQFVGIERFMGTLGGLKGSFALRHIGSYGGSEARAELTVIHGSGTGELAGITGTARFDAGHAERHALALEYEIK